MLLVGSGIAVGYGVSSPDLALGGYLARGVASRTGRGASIETIARFGLRVDDVPAALENFHLTRVDAIVMTLGSDEALHVVPLGRFSASVTRLLDWVERTAPSSLGVMIVGIPDVTSIMKVPAPIERMVQRQCALLDGELRRLVQQHPRIRYIPFNPAPADLARDGDRHIYALWAALLTPAVSDELDLHLADPRDPATIQEARRQMALDDLNILDTPTEPRFDRIVRDACQLFRVRGASITFIDRERQWSKAVIGIDAIDSPRGSALGDATVNNGKLFVLEDAGAEWEYSGHPWVAGASAVRFFAGFPIEAANGERIGALCICDSNPRSFNAQDDAMLGLLASQVEGELWGKPARALAGNPA